jgi:O-antigen ligase
VIEGTGSPDEAIGGLIPRRDLVAHGVLLTLAGWCVWRPVETCPSTAVWVAAATLGLAVWAWRRTPRESNPWLLAGAVGGVLGASGMAGWDPASAVVEIALLAAVVALIWLASRVAPPDGSPALLALVISALSLWGLWQVAGGMDRAVAEIGLLPEVMRTAAAERLTSGRAFASQILPSHLAVLLATALPLLLVRLRPGWSAAPWAVGSTFCVVGLVLTRSPVGAALALGACVVLALGRRKRLLLWIALFLILVLVVVVSGRSDVVRLEPVKLRLDNWQTAIWVWSQTPAAGVGVGGFAQAAQAIPFGVGNRPRHAHSMPLEWLAELGPLGLLACVLAALALWRLLRDLWPERPELSVALAVIPAHNLVDFSFYSSGVALVWAILLGWAMATRSQIVEPISTPARGRSVFVAAVTLALAASVLHLTSIAVEDSATIREAPIERLNGAIEANRLAPWRVDPLGLVAAAALETGDPERISDALAELDRGRRLRPRSAAFAALRARLAMAAGEAPTAVAETWASATEQPSNTAHAESLEALLKRLDSGAENDDS